MPKAKAEVRSFWEALGPVELTLLPPVVWNCVTLCALAYLAFLHYLLLKSPKSTRALLHSFDENMGVPQPDRDYGANCEVTMEVVLSIMDRFIVAHLVGWFLKAYLVRQWSLIWLLSVQWEVIELLTKYFIPNFGECWWDALVVDLALCNAVGIALAFYLFQRTNTPLWHWSELFSPTAFLRQMHALFSGRFGIDRRRRNHKDNTSDENKDNSDNEHELTSDEEDEEENDNGSVQLWFAVLEPRKCEQWLYVNVVIVVLCLLDMNGFLLKLFLYVPTEHSANLWRLGVVYAIALPATRDFYDYASGKKANVGSSVQLLAFILCAELTLIFKVSTAMPPMPVLNKVALLVMGVWYAAHSAVMCLATYERHDKVR